MHLFKNYINKCVILCVFFANGFAEELHYSLSVDQESYKVYHVAVRVQQISRPRLVFSMPIWIPGSYYVENTGGNVLDFKAASSSGQPLRVTSLSRNDWEVLPDAFTDITVTYDVLPSDFSFVGEGMDSTGALVQAASTWMYLRDMEQLPVQVHIDAPAGWRIATGLPGGAAANFYQAHNYDELADCPIMMGALRDTVFVYMNKPYELYFRGEATFDMASFTAMVHKIVEFQTTLMGDVPYERYVFQFTLFPGYRDGGGLEHCNSTSIGLSSIRVMKDVNSAANIIAHEFFHVWNVKRLTSDQLQPLRYDREARMQSLWWLEGVTSYYADLTLLRTGLWSVEQFLDNQEREIVYLEENPDREETSLAQASWDIWENGYTSSHISYYNKGQLIGLVLDIMIRKVTRNNKTLDDILLELYRTFAMNRQGFTDDQLQATVERVTGKDFSSFFDRYITGLVDVPFAELLQYAGFTTRIEKEQIPSLGRVRLLERRNEIFSLDASSAAYQAGLRRSDYILSVDGQAFSGEGQLAHLIQEKRPGQTVAVTVERNGAKIDLNVALDSLERVKCEIEIMEKPSQEQLAIRDGLLKRKSYE
jgi:predicted metalloprotease with PDZ domain